MKTNFPLVIVLMLVFSFGYAQSEELTPVTGDSKTISVSSFDDSTASHNVEMNKIENNDSLLIDASKLKSTISRTNSDIRIYLYRKRKAGNISFVFPKINKAVRA